MPEPNHRLTKPNLAILTTLVRIDATIESPIGTIIQIRKKASICPKVTDVPTCTASFSPTAPNNARATNSPAIKPTMEITCFIKPFIKPTIAPNANIITMTKSNDSIFY